MNKITSVKFLRLNKFILCLINISPTFAEMTPMPQPRSITVNKESQYKVSNEQKEKNPHKSTDCDKERLMIKINNLCSAIASRNLKKVNEVLAEEDIDVNELCISFNMPPLFVAIDVNDPAMVQRLVDTPGIILTSTGDNTVVNNWLFDGDGSGITPLMYAIDLGNCDIAKFLILTAKEKNQDIGINLQDRIGRTALFYASYNVDINSVKLLLDEGANPLILDHQGKKASDYTTKPEIHELLLNVEKNWLAKQDSLITFKQENIHAK